MPIEFPCPGCRQKLKAPANAGGWRARCPQFRRSVTVPELVTVIDSANASPADRSPAEVVEQERRPCPICGALIRPNAIKCRYCGAVFNEVPGSARLLGNDERRLSLDEYVLALLPGVCLIGLAFGVLYLIQGSPKSGRMIRLSLLSVVLSVVITLWALQRSVW